VKFFRLLRAVLREIFDESAYERFCAREGVQCGQESYVLFLRSKDVRVRCC
jgi:hypothetical protein